MNLNEAKTTPWDDIILPHNELSALRHVLDEAAIVAVTDLNGAIIYANDKFCEVTKYSRAELLGEDHQLLESGYHPATYFLDLWAAIRAGKVWRGEICNHAKDGATYWVDTTIIPLLDESGKPYQFISISYDITMKKMAEQQVVGQKEILKALALNAPLREILDLTADAVKLVLPDSLPTILLANEDETHLFSGSVRDLPDEYNQAVSGIKIADNTGSCGTAAFHRKAVVVSDIANDPLWKNFKDLAASHGLAACWSQPIISASGRLLGTFAVYFKEPREPAGLEFTALEEAARVAAIAIENKRASDALADSEERYRLLFEGNPLPAWVVNNETLDVMAVNEAAINHYGYTREEFLKLNATDMRPAEEIPKFLEAVRKYRDTEGRTSVVSKHIKKSGEPIDVEISSHRIIFKGVPASFLIAQDITERKKAEERIAQQASLLDKTHDAVIVCNPEYLITFWNAGAEKIYGWKAGEVMGRYVADVLSYAESKQIRQTQKYLKTHDEWFGELKNYTKERKRLDVESRWALIRDNEGNPDYFLIVNKDVTDRKAFEYQLLRAQRMESIGTLAGGIAHDLNNILSPILMAVDMLRMKPLDDEAKRWLSILNENAQRSANLVRQVLSFARGVEGERVNMQPRHIIKELIKILRETLPKSITLKHNLPDDLWTIYADATQIHQVLMNVCINARDAMPDGGTLRIHAGNATIDEDDAEINRIPNPGKYLQISISDTGIGMPEEVIGRIFDPFFTTKDVSKGTGLGLATAQSIVKSHEGFINVMSYPGNGTTFKIYLPATNAKHDAVSTTSEVAFESGGETILVVDDEENIRYIIKSALEKFGYRVVTATDGTDALSIYARQKEEIDLVLTDIAMPYMDGIATIRALRRLTPSLRIIASSGIATPEQSAELTSLNVNNFISKPFSTERLVKTIGEALKQ